MRLIDADALKEEVNKKKVVGRFNTLLLIDNAPTIKSFTLLDIEEQYRKGLEKGLSEWETERPKGEWIDHSCYKGVNICSNCGIGGNRFYKDFKFCPNCGADMKGGAK